MVERPPSAGTARVGDPGAKKSARLYPVDQLHRVSETQRPARNCCHFPTHRASCYEYEYGVISDNKNDALRDEHSQRRALGLPGRGSYGTLNYTWCGVDAVAFDEPLSIYCGIRLHHLLPPSHATLPPTAVILQIHQTNTCLQYELKKQQQTSERRQHSRHVVSEPRQ